MFFLLFMNTEMSRQCFGGCKQAPSLILEPVGANAPKKSQVAPYSEVLPTKKIEVLRNMSSEESLDVVEKLPDVNCEICQHDYCHHSKKSHQIFYGKEIDHRYNFYLATLRAQQDSQFLMRHHSDLVLQIQNAEAENVALRKEVRLLETELYIMSQRNVHDSPIIDGLQEADYEAEEANTLASLMRRSVETSSIESNNEDSLIKMLEEEIFLLKRMDVEDEEIVKSFKPVGEMLKKTLAEEKVKTHQHGMAFARELHAMLEEYRKRKFDMEAIANEKTSAAMWMNETFSAAYDTILGINQPPPPPPVSEDETSSIQSSTQGTDSFAVSTEEDFHGTEDLGETFQAMKAEYCELVAKKELMDMKNIVNFKVVHDCVKRYIDGVKILSNEYLSVYQATADIEFIKEYIERLDAIRAKKDIVNREHTAETAQRLDQLNMINECLMNERDFWGILLESVGFSLLEDFRTHCVILNKTEALFCEARIPKPETEEEGQSLDSKPD